MKVATLQNYACKLTCRQTRIQNQINPLQRDIDFTKINVNETAINFDSNDDLETPKNHNVDMFGALQKTLDIAIKTANSPKRSKLPNPDQVFDSACDGNIHSDKVTWR